MAAARSTAVTRGGRRARTPLVDVEKQFHDFLYNWGLAKEAGSARDKARDAIKKWFAHGGDADHEVTVNDNGSQLVEFESVLEIGGRKFTGVENRRTATSALDMDRIDEWLESMPKAQRDKIQGKIFRKVTDYVLEPDELFRLNQEGVIDDETLDSLYSTSVTWSLNVVQG